MKKFLSSLGIFAAFGIVMYVIFVGIHGLLLPKQIGGNVLKYDQKNTYTASRIAEADTTGNIDVLIIGSSHAYRGYDTRTFNKMGYRTMNLGTSAQTLVQTKLLLDKYVDKLQPEYVIIDIFPSIISTSGTESTMELVSVTGYDKNLYELALKSLDIRAYNTLIISALQSMFNLKDDYTKDLPSKKMAYYPGGFVGYKSTVFKDGCDDSKKAYINVNVKGETLDELKEITDMLKQRNIKYFLFQAPLSTCRYKAITNNQQIDAAFKQYGPYYNFNTIKLLPDTYFIDDSHLNSKGVEVYNNYVLRKLAEAGIKPRG